MMHCVVCRKDCLASLRPPCRALLHWYTAQPDADPCQCICECSPCATLRQCFICVARMHEPTGTLLPYWHRCQPSRREQALQRAAPGTSTSCCAVYCGPVLIISRIAICICLGATLNFTASAVAGPHCARQDRAESQALQRPCQACQSCNNLCSKARLSACTDSLSEPYVACQQDPEVCWWGLPASRSQVMFVA